MSNEDKPGPSQQEIMLDLAKQRTLLSLDNTLLAWIRTSLTLIAFGFTLSKFVRSALPGDPKWLGIEYPKLAGLCIMGIGFLGLASGAFEYLWSAKKLKSAPHVYPASLVVAGTLSLITIILMLALAFEPALPLKSLSQ